MIARAGRVGRWLRKVVRRGWGRVEPALRDAALWLIYRAPLLLLRWVGRWVWRGLKATPRALVLILWWTLLGTLFVLRHTARYCIGYHDFAGVVADARDRGKPRQERLWRQRWRQAVLRRVLTITATGTLLTLMAVWVVHRYGGLAETGIITGLVAVVAGIGRATRPPKTPPDTPAEDGPSDARAPFPIADARTRAEAADALTRALHAEGIGLRHCEDPTRAAWGWTIPVVLRAGTPAAIVAKAGHLETHLDLPAGGVLASPDLSRRARVVLRLVQHDPFAHLTPPAVRAPRSLLITRCAVIGACIDGHPLAVPLLGVHGVIVGSPGSGKTTTLLAVADAVSACEDAVVWDLDPAGDGLRALGAGVDLRHRGHADTEAALATALLYAQARLQLAGELGMARGEWHPTRERPAIVVFVDEYPQLTAKAKQSAVDLLRVGRKARVTLILAATEATSDALGAAIATTTGLKVLHACRPSDIQLVLGPGKAAEGWRPDRLHPATADTPGDAGICYVSTGGYREPLLSKISPIDVDGAEQQGDQRAEAGLPKIDAGTQYRAALVDDNGTTKAGNGTRDGAGGAVTAAARWKPVWDAVMVFDTDQRLWTEELLRRLAAHDDHYAEWTADDLADAVRPFGIVPAQIKQDGINRRGYHRDALIHALDKATG